ncbi:MAG: FHA domain-containing protein [Actinomycetota bacterium]|nr:FHA domain-containing protein [Actinomycetota bacterium]HZY66079.1 FHA domain-containing protein [Rubrobacteraceae bacterium]
MLELEVPLLAAKALLLLLLFAFIYSVVSRSIGDLRQVPDKPAGNEERRNGQKQSSYRRVISSGKPELVVESSGIMASELRFPINDGSSTSLGRSSKSDIVLKSDDYVSGEHARITRHGGLLYVEDNGSTNGTYVNERKTVGATPLRAGDSIRVGSTTFRFVE